uniref:Retrotransposon protein, putative, unclassified, expressed n=1 Tax=Oryza sativa subsp. japonica TaxID=39947 RepID=Q10J47_ORYSJ|nr:retrotransposon protein, putative, unclassified, expressed [Oryza sativa Japonica Group]
MLLARLVGPIRSQKSFLMDDKPPASLSSASPGSVKEKIQQLGLSEVNESNIVTITPDKLTPDQKKDFEAMMQQAGNQFLSSFMQSRKGTVVQKYKVKVVADVPGTGSSKDGEVKQAPDGSAQPSDKGAADGSQGNQGDNSQGVKGVQGDGAQGVQGEGPNQDGNAAQLQFNNFQDQVDYVVHHALINQSGILTNTLANMVKSMVDGSMAEYQATGPVYLPGGSTAPLPAPAPAAPPSAPGQLVNPRLLVKEQPQHSGQNMNRLTQDQVASMFLPPQHAIDLTQQQPIQQTPPRQQVVQPIQQTPPVQQVVQPIQQTLPVQQVVEPIQQTPQRRQVLQPIQQMPLKQLVVQLIQQQGSMNASARFAIPGGQPVQHAAKQVVPEHLVHHGGNLNYQYQPPSPQVQYQQAGSAQPQFVPQYNQFEPVPQQSQGTPQQRPWADLIADVMKEQFGLRPKDSGNLYRQPYPEWFKRVPLPNRFKVLDFSKFSRQDSTSAYEHVSRFLAQCGEASAVDALRVRLFRLSLSGSAFTWFSSLPYGSINSWANLEKHFHSYFYSGVHEMKLSDLTAIKQRHDEPVHEYIQRFREMSNKCYNLSLTDAQEKFSSEDFESLSHLTQKVTLHEQRFAEARKNSRKVNHVCPYIYGSDDEDDDSEIAAAEWVRSKKVIPCQWVKNSGKEERYDFNITKADKIFDLLLREKQIQLPTGHTIPSAEEIGQEKIQAAIEGGKIMFDDSKRPMKVDGNPFPINMVHTTSRIADGGRARGFQANSAKIINKYQRKYDKQQVKYYEEDDDGFDPCWGCEFFRFCWNEGMRLPSIKDCPGYSDTAESSSRSYSRGNRLRQTRVPVHQRLGPVNQDRSREDNETRKLNGVLLFGINQADDDEVEEESAKLILSPEQAVFEKPEDTENRHLKPFYINGYVNGKPMSKMMVDGAVNLMPYTMFRKLGRNAEDLIKTNMVLKDFGGNPSETEGVLNVELTVGNKTIPTTQLKMENPSYYFEGIVEGSNVYTKDTVDDLDDKQGQGFMSGDDLEEIDIGPGVRPHQQPPRRCKADTLEPVKAEIKRLYDASFIRPCRYDEWVSSIVPVIKKNGKVRVCIDFRNLNKATPKDEYPMPGTRFFSFMDGNAGYNQIFMAEEDIHKIAFRCPGAIGLFEWVVMTFGLKSAGATYQRDMNYIYHDLIDWLVEVYIGDVVVKSKEIEDHIADLRKIFERTRKYGLKMNPTKCAFGVSAGQFLGFLVHERGIEVTQRSVNAIKKIQPPESKTELQEIIGKINFVRRFISNLSGRLEPFTPLLRLKADQQFTWGAEQQKALDCHTLKILNI